MDDVKWKMGNYGCSIFISDPDSYRDGCSISDWAYR